MKEKGKKRRKTETNPFSRFICFTPTSPLFLLDIDISPQLLTDNQVNASNKACLFICPPLQKDIKHVSKRDNPLNDVHSVNAFNQLGVQSILKPDMTNIKDQEELHIILCSTNA